MYRRSSLILFAISSFFLLISGCGGGNAAPMAATPTAGGGSSANPAPAPGPAPTPAPGSNPGIYQVQLVANGSYATVGQVTVDAISNNGDVEVKLSQGAA